MTNDIRKTTFNSGTRSIESAEHNGNLIPLQGLEYFSEMSVNNADNGESFKHTFEYDCQLISLMASPSDRNGETNVILTGEVRTGEIEAPFALPMNQLTRYLFVYTFAPMFLYEGDEMEVTIPDDFKLLRLIYKPVITFTKGKFNKV